MGEMNWWLPPTSSQQGVLPGGSPAEEGGHICMLHGKCWGLCSLTGAKPLCPWVIKNSLQRPGAGYSILGLTFDSQHTSLPQHHSEMEGPRQTNACGARTVPSDWYLECSGRNSGLVSCFLLLT